ncbi:hypothetical protein GGR51DRAFT_532416 [Nemania sp. FL0031]|nr:hypothetical protein GGR51DRAFT_532416 [Nemania sp. FL0031]
MHDIAIPLFRDEKSDEDYQLHPSYSRLKMNIRPNDCIPGIFGLSAKNTEDVTELQKIRFFIPLGRLFVNAQNGNCFNKRCNSFLSRITRWTGYEVFLGSDLAIWIVFDAQSLTRGAEPWYPVSCGITERIQRASIARLLPRFADLETAEFEDAVSSAEEMRWAIEVQISYVKKEDGDMPVPQARPQLLQPQPTTTLETTAAVPLEPEPAPTRETRGVEPVGAQHETQRISRFRRRFSQLLIWTQ